MPWVSATSSWELLHTTIAISISQRKETFCLPFLLSRLEKRLKEKKRRFVKKKKSVTHQMSNLAYVGSTPGERRKRGGRGGEEKKNRERESCRFIADGDVAKHVFSKVMRWRAESLPCA